MVIACKCLLLMHLVWPVHICRSCNQNTRSSIMQWLPATAKGAFLLRLATCFELRPFEEGGSFCDRTGRRRWVPAAVESCFSVVEYGGIFASFRVQTKTVEGQSS
jgi:hypothetical protein